MAYYIVNGGIPLKGDVTISGAKNAAVAIIPAAILCGKPCRLENIPHIEDVFMLIEILTDMGAVVHFEGDQTTLFIDPSGIHTTTAVHPLMAQLRASYYLLGALVGRYGEAEISFPGGCAIGTRPVDLHMKGLQALNVTAWHDDKKSMLVAHVNEQGLVCKNEIYLDVASVGATINIMLAACCAKGTTVINNAAKEPHVVDVANFLNMMGAKIKGAGTDSIRIVGVTRDSLHGCTYAIIPDQIEAGTYMLAAAATRGDVYVHNIIPTHLEATIAKMLECGVKVDQIMLNNEYVLHVRSTMRPRKVKVETCPYPGFPTDLQQPMMAFLATANGDSLIIDNIWADRFKHVAELIRMGANMDANNNGSATIHGVDSLHGGTEVLASDLRAGAALIVAALMAKGKTIIRNINFIDRGYEKVVEKFTSLGANIVRVEEDNSAPSNN